MAGEEEEETRPQVASSDDNLTGEEGGEPAQAAAMLSRVCALSYKPNE